MIKTQIKRFCIFLVILVMMLSLLSACSTRLMGTYTSKTLVQQSLTFKLNNVVVMSAFGINAEGTYKIKDGKITFTYKLLNISYDWTKDFEKKGNSIFIDGTEFVKE